MSGKPVSEVSCAASLKLPTVPRLILPTMPLQHHLGLTDYNTMERLMPPLTPHTTPDRPKHLAQTPQDIFSIKCQNRFLRAE
jgi:hypothetical protein